MLKGGCIEVADITLLRHLSADTWPQAYMDPKIIHVHVAIFDGGYIWNSNGVIYI